MREADVISAHSLSSGKPPTDEVYKFALKPLQWKSSERSSPRTHGRNASEKTMFIAAMRLKNTTSFALFEALKAPREVHQINSEKYLERCRTKTFQNTD